MAAAIRSASGSLASAISAPTSRARATADPSRPALPGSGTTRSGRNHRAVAARRRRTARASPLRSNAASTVAPPTPCIAVYAAATPATSGRSRTAGTAARYRGRRSVVEHFDQRVVGRGERDRGRIERIDAGGDADVVRRHDLRAVAEVHLVAVVGRRVVAGGDHDARDRVELGDVPRQHRCRQRRRQQHRPHAHRGEHPGGVEREVVALAAGVVADDDAALGGVRATSSSTYATEPGRGLADDQSVHPQWTGAHLAAQAGGAELQPAGETRARARSAGRRSAPPVRRARRRRARRRARLRPARTSIVGAHQINCTQFDERARTDVGDHLRGGDRTRAGRTRRAVDRGCSRTGTRPRTGRQRRSCRALARRAQRVRR